MGAEELLDDWDHILKKLRDLFSETDFNRKE